MIETKMVYKYSFFILILLLLININCKKNKTYDPVEVSLSYSLPDEFLSENAYIKANVKGGVEPYNYSWYNMSKGYLGSISESSEIKNISSGFYKVVISDSNFNTVSDSIFILSKDTIESNIYLAAYPGSYWVYSNNVTVFCDEIRKFAYKPNASMEYDIYPSDSVYLPVLENKPILNNSYLNYSFRYVHEVILVSDIVGAVYGIQQDTRQDNTMVKVLTVDTTLNINGSIYNDVIIIEKRIGPPDVPYEEMYNWSRHYYSKGIGKIRHDLWSNSKSEYLINIEIVEYYINI